MSSGTSLQQGRRQIRFPARKRYAFSRIRPSHTRLTTDSQSTLTQLNFVNISSSRSDTSSVSDVADEESTEAGPRKRRKVNPSEAEASRRQSTLTQWEWLEKDGLSDVEAQGGEDDQNSSDTPNTPQQDGDSVSMPTSPGGQDSHENTGPLLTSSPLSKVLEKNFKTPPRTRPREIPSSQSPPTTPLSLKKSASVPLKEISPNDVEHFSSSRLYNYAQPSSQATTVDLTPSRAEPACNAHGNLEDGRDSSSGDQLLPELQQPEPDVHYHSPNFSPASSPMPFETQVPSSLLSLTEEKEYSLLQPVQNSEAVVTLSQLLPESMRNDEA